MVVVTTGRGDGSSVQKDRGVEGNEDGRNDPR